MKSYFILFVLVIFAIDAARALECYQCEYHDGAPLEGGPIDDDEDYIHESCKSGNKPKKSLLHECESGEDVCVKVYVSGERDGEQIKSTIRDCSVKDRYPGLENGKCQDKNGKELSDLIGIRMPDDFKGTLCVCRGDKCNSSSMIKMKNGLIAITFGLLVFKFFD